MQEPPRFNGIRCPLKAPPFLGGPCFFCFGGEETVEYVYIYILIYIYIYIHIDFYNYM